MKFEASENKEKYDLIENHRFQRAKSLIPSFIMWMFSIEMEENSAYINYLHITNGCINQSLHLRNTKRLNETKEELLQLGIIEMRERYKRASHEIIKIF